MSYDILSGLSDDELAGINDILGAAARKAKKGARLQNRFDRREERGADGMLQDFLGRRINRLLGSKSEFVEQGPGVGRRYTFSLGRITVPTGETDNLKETTQRVIRIERLVLSSSALADFDVTGIAIGVDLQFANIAATPAEAFAYNAVGTSLRGNTLQIGQSATVTVLNNNVADKNIGGAFLGESEQQV